MTGEDDDVSVDEPAETLTSTFDTVADAVASSMWHTIIDGAGTEDFVDDFDLSHLRKAERELQSTGYATDGLSAADVYRGGDGSPSGAAFFVGDGAADAIREHDEQIMRLCDGDVDGVGDGLPWVDGFLVEEASGIPSNLIVFLDVDAIARVPAEARSRSVGLDTTPTVSSPVIVRDPNGVAVVNIDKD